MAESVVEPIKPEEAGSVPANPAEANNAVVQAAIAAGVKVDPTPDVEPVVEPTIVPDPAAGKEDPTTPKKEDPKGFVEVGGKRYYASFDKHPEWDGMRASKTATNKILEEHGYSSMPELLVDLKSGLDIKALLGDADAQTLIDNSQKWTAAEEVWAEQDAVKLEEGETQDETVKRLKDENKQIKESQKRETTDRQALEDGKNTITRYDTDVSTVVEASEGLTDNEKLTLKTLLGVKNPMDDVDISDAKAIRLAAKDGADKFKTFLADVKQGAIDEYSEGKSKMVPIGKSGADDVVAVDPTKIDTSKGVDESFSQANKLLVELASSGQATM